MLCYAMSILILVLSEGVKTIFVDKLYKMSTERLLFSIPSHMPVPEVSSYNKGFAPKINERQQQKQRNRRQKKRRKKTYLRRRMMGISCDTNGLISMETH